jgi:serine/threonine protein kinase
VKDLIWKMLDKDHRKRISASEAKKHPWFMKHCHDWSNPSKNLIKTIIQHAKRSIKTKK